MDIEFDAAKDQANRAKHGVSLALATDFEADAIVADTRREYGEPRFNAIGRIDGRFYALTFTPRGGKVRVISLRRAHAKEYRRHV
jgi:uncharacterized DUF497 family protein